MVAGSGYRDPAASWCYPRPRRQQRYRTIHLFSFLMKKPGRKYETLLVITAGLLVLWYFKRNELLLFIAIGVSVGGLLISPLGTLIDWFWYKIAHVLGAVMSRVILGAFFFFILTPIALLRKIFTRKDVMKLRKEYDSLWVVRDHLYTAKDIENPW